MATPGITNTPSAASTSATAASDPSSAMANQADFLKLLSAQLQNQDPLNPVSNSDFTAQLAQFSTLSGVQQLNTSTQQMLALQQISQGASLVGKSVTYNDANNNPASGTVGAVDFQNNQLLLQIGGKSVPSSNLTSIQS
jgi:flagellar basal-body rod modification protein FlgD